MRSLASALVDVGITTAFSYPGYSVDELLGVAADTEGLSLVVNASETSAAAAAHGHWMVTGRPAALLVADGAGVDMAAPMIGLAVREGAGVLVIVPGVLPGPHRSAAVLEAAGAVVVGLEDLDLREAVNLVGSGKVVAALMGSKRVLQASAAVPVWTDSHSGIVLGPAATATQIRRAEAHSCPVITTAGARIPDVLRPRWLGPMVAGSKPGVFDLIGLGATDAGALAGIATPAGMQGWLHSQGSRTSIVPEHESGKCQPAQLRSDGAKGGGHLLLDSLLALAAHLPNSILVSDAGASHKLTGQAAATTGNPVVGTLGPTTMGWAPGAALGAALATGQPVILSIGDGSLAMAGLQLFEWRRYGVAGVIVGVHNGTLGSVKARLGDNYPGVTSCAVSPSVVWESLGVPWKSITQGSDPDPAVAWASDTAASGQLAALTVDTTGLEALDCSWPSGLVWWDAITGGTPVND